MIELREVCFSYYLSPVLEKVSARFEAGKLCALVGPNGCGKTTLLRLMGRLRRPQSGELRLMDRAYDAYGRKEFAKTLALLPQTRPVPAISVRDFVSHGRFPYQDLSRRLSTEDEEKIETALRATDTLRLASRALTELSGGERQRAYLALLLAQDTACVLLDEPTTYLDISSQFAVMELLKKMRDSGKCVVAVLHDLPLALRFCDEVFVMSDGRINASGTPAQIVGSGALDRVFNVRCEITEHMGNMEYIIRPRGDIE